MARLLIGSYILDSADSGSTSTTPGVTLSLPKEAALSYNASKTELSTGIFFAQIDSASEAAHATAIEAVRAAIQNSDGLDIVFEETAGVTLWQLVATEWATIEGGVELADIGALSSEIGFGFNASKAGEISSGAGDPEGMLTPINWQYEEIGGGLGAMVGRALFGSTTGSARQNAVTYSNLFLDETNFATIAPFLNTNFRRTDSVVEFEQSQNQPSVIPEGGYKTAILTITMMELDSGVATWPDLVQAATYNVNQVERPPIDRNSGQTSPGFDFALSGTLLLKTEGSTVWDPASTKLATADVRSRAITAVQGIITHIKALYQSFGLTQLGEILTNIDEPTGNVGFGVLFTSATILDWAETAVVFNDDQKAWSRDDGGKDTEYKQAGGPVKTLDHSLRVVTIGAPIAYRPPRLSDKWSRAGIRVRTRVPKVFANFIIQSETEGSSTWRFVNASEQDGGGERATTAGLFEITGIGNGNL